MRLLLGLIKKGEKMTDINVIFEQLKELTSLPGVSGNEHKVVKYLKEKFADISDEVFVDSFGNLVALRRGGKPGPRFMVTAHSDEVGGVVTSITKDGFLGFCPVGVIDPKILPATRMLVDQRIIGTVACVPGHASADQDGQNKFSKNLYIDIGAITDMQVYDLGINIGSTASFISPATRMIQDNLVMGKAMDNRIGCVILLQLFKRLKGKKFAGELHGVVTVQEEIAMSGARMIPSRINPDFAIVMDTVPLDDTPLQSMPDIPMRLGNGPVIQLRTGKNSIFLGTVAHENVSSLIFSAAEELKMPIQRIAAYGKWVTDAEVIHTSGKGIPLGFLSIPRRYGHTPNEMIDLNDVSKAIDIITLLVEKKADQFTPAFIKE
jgi:putative aminopeptidase FrvX